MTPEAAAWRRRELTHPCDECLAKAWPAVEPNAEQPALFREPT